MGTMSMTVRWRPATPDKGFTLIEALVALLLVSGLVAGTSHLLVVALASTRDARDETSAACLAVERLEQLAAAVEAGAALTASPDDALEQDTPGFNDRVDTSGAAASAGSPSYTVFVRRWRLTALSAGPLPAWRIQVRVLLARVAALPGAGPGAGGGRRAGEVLLTTTRRRP